jgi:hypothetical protein
MQKEEGFSRLSQPDSPTIILLQPAEVSRRRKNNPREFGDLKPIHPALTKCRIRIEKVIHKCCRNNSDELMNLGFDLWEKQRQ